MSPLSRRPRIGKSLRRTSSPGNRPGIASIGFPLVSLGFETLVSRRSLRSLLKARLGGSSTSGAGLDVFVVALGLELVSQLRAALFHHPAVDEDVHEVGG